MWGRCKCWQCPHWVTWLCSSRLPWCEGSGRGWWSRTRFPLITNSCTGLAVRRLCAVLTILNYRLKLDEYLIPMKWGSFLGGCALLVFLPLNIYVVRIHCICLIYYPTLLNNVGPKWFNVWDGFNGVRPLGVHGSFCNPWSTLHSRPLALYGCSAQNLLQWKVGVLAFLSRCNLSTRRKDDFIMITNSFLPWRSDHLSLTEGSIVHAPTKRCDLFKHSYFKDFTFFQWCNEREFMEASSGDVPSKKAVYWQGSFPIRVVLQVGLFITASQKSNRSKNLQ